MLENRLFHLSDVPRGCLGFGVETLSSVELNQLGADRDEHAGDQDGFRNAAVRGAVSLEGFARRRRVAVQVQAVVPVRAADQGQTVRALVVHHVVERCLQMLEQRARIVGVGVVGRFLVQDSEIACLFDIGRRTRDQPEGIVVEAAADRVIAFFGQRLVLVVTAAVPELCRCDIQDALAGALGNLMDEAQQIL